jgi:protein-S-isoprenylcysteine O-methyltransferase Ste14
MSGSIFKTLYFLELILISSVRTLSTSKYRRLKTEEDHSTSLDKTLLGLSALGMLVPLIYIFSPWLDFADYHLPDILGWIGAILFALAACLLWITHLSLGRNWTPTLGFRQEHNLVTNGIYKYIRHPMYAAHLLWAVAQPLMLQNWIAGFSFLVVAVPQYFLRVGAEEEMMIKKFGDEYSEYMKTTGRLLPKL